MREALTMARTINASLPSSNHPTASSKENLTESFTIDNIDSLPKSCETIPENVTNLRQCALNEIHSLIHKSSTSSTSGIGLTPQEEDALDDGFILCDLSVIQQKLIAWHKMFPRIKPFFALKCNPDPMVAAILGGQEQISGFDCASIAEINLALQSSNGNTTRCVYANPQRADADLEAALSLGVEALTFDGAEELRKVSEAHQRRLQRWKDIQKLNNKENKEDDSTSTAADDAPQPPEMILRIVVPDGSSSVPLGEKFGAAPKNIKSLIQEALDLGLPVIGVSFHCGSGCHDPEAYGTAIKIAKDAIDIVNDVRSHHPDYRGKEHEDIKCTLLDIGGGYPGYDGVGADTSRFCGKINTNIGVDTCGDKDDDEHESALKIAQVVTPLVNELFPPSENQIQIISEPGRYFVEASFAYCARIYTTKIDYSEDGVVEKRHYYIAQGVQGIFKDVLLCGESFVPMPLFVNEEKLYENKSCSDEELKDDDTTPQKEEEHGSESFLSIVHGPSGEDFDIVCNNCYLPKLKVGDWLLFDRMGAYTTSIAARNSCLSTRYVIGGTHT